MTETLTRAPEVTEVHPWHALTVEEVCRELGVDPYTELDSSEVATRRAEHGGSLRGPARRYRGRLGPVRRALHQQGPHQGDLDPARACGAVGRGGGQPLWGEEHGVNPVATVGLFYIYSANYSPFNISGERALTAIGGGMAIALFSYVGVECVAVAAGNVRDPDRNVPRATLYGTLATAAVYMLSLIAVFGVLISTSMASVAMLVNYLGSSGANAFTTLVLMTGITAAIPYGFSAVAQIKWRWAERRALKTPRFARDMTSRSCRSRSRSCSSYIRATPDTASGSIGPCFSSPAPPCWPASRSPGARADT